MMSTTNLLTLFKFLFIINCVSGTEDELLHRSKRQLLFPNSTVLQINIGIGTPTAAALINLNYAIQANFQLPWNRTQIPIDLLEANNGYTGDSRKKRNEEVGVIEDSNVEDRKDVDERREYDNDSRLYHFYKYVEGVLSGFGHNGTTCVLRTLCQLGAEPLHTHDEEDLLHEVAGFVLNPKNDAEHTSYKEEIAPYVEAYELGENLQDCSAIYDPCSVPLLDMFSKPHKNVL